jgi:DNA transposition AAA+ family ATPase
MTNLDKNEIVNLISQEKNKLGSANKVATRCRVSPATISQMINGNWELIADEMWLQVGAELGYTTSTWKLAEIGNYVMIKKLLDFARFEHEYLVISAKAGSGKTATINQYRQLDQTGGVFVIQARDWARREFMINLCQTLGISLGTGYTSVDKLGEMVIRYFIDRKSLNPVLIIDEADKLKPAALRYLIHFYNDLENIAGCVIAGTENLEKEIKKGVQYSRKGFDELDSRFGRNYIHLKGATMQDVREICAINGITDPEVSRIVFENSYPTGITFQDRHYKVVEDLRRVKRAIKRELMKLQAA